MYIDYALVLKHGWNGLWRSINGNDPDQIVMVDGEDAPTKKELDNYWDAHKIEIQKETWRKSVSLSRRKFKVGISLYEIDGENLKTKIESALESLPEPHKTIAQVSYEDGTEFERMDDMVVMLAQEIGLSDEEVDDFFEWANNEEWR